jgi:hypothetical protein
MPDFRSYFFNNSSFVQTLREEEEEVYMSTTYGTLCNVTSILEQGFRMEDTKQKTEREGHTSN